MLDFSFFENQQKMIDRVIRVAEWIKSIIPTCVQFIHLIKARCKMLSAQAVAPVVTVNQQHLSNISSSSFTISGDDCVSCEF